MRRVILHAETWYLFSIIPVQTIKRQYWIIRLDLRRYDVFRWYGLRCSSL